jgi:hypothetical protein
VWHVLPQLIAGFREVLDVKVIFGYPGVPPRFPYLVLDAGQGCYYKVLLRGRFVFVSRGTTLVNRGPGELDIPHVGAGRAPIGDFVYAAPEEARAVFERFRHAPEETLATVLAGRKP